MTKAAKAHKDRYGEPQVGWDDHGTWVTCPCGWRSKIYPTVNLAAHEYAEHSDGPLLCENCGKPMAEHDRLAQCWGDHNDGPGGGSDG